MPQTVVLQSLVRLERSIRDAQSTDKPLVGWWLYVLVLSWLTCGIMPIVIYFQRIGRRNDHCKRMDSVFRAMVECTREVATSQGVDVNHELGDIEAKLTRAESSFISVRNPGLCFVLSLVTGGIYTLYVYYFLMRDFYLLQQFEQELLFDFSKIWSKLGITKYPIKMDGHIPDRSFWLYLVLTVVTLGIWAYVWDYAVHTDPEKLFKDSAMWEETVLQAFRAV